MQSSTIISSRSAASGVVAPRRGVAAARQGVHRTPLHVARGVQFNQEFMETLQKSLEREEMRIAAKIGLPGLQLHEEVEEGGEEGTGNLIWTSGVRLSQHLVRNRGNELKGARVLDLGSGTGIVGITAACLGAHVMLTDVRDVLPQIFDNIQSNAALIEQAGGSATVSELDWRDPDDEVLDQDYDWVFGSDVTYCEDHLPALAKLLRQLVLTSEDSSVVKLAHMHRSKELDNAMREAFHDEGLQLRPVDVRTTSTTVYEDPLKVDEAIVFYRVGLDPALRELVGEGEPQQ